MSQIITYLRDSRVDITARMPILKKSSIRRKPLARESHDFDNFTLGATYIEDFDPIYRKRDFR